MAVWHLRCLEGVKAKLHAKFGENRTNGSGVIQVLEISRWRPGPSWIMNFAILRARTSSEYGVDDTCHIWCI